MIDRAQSSGQPPNYSPIFPTNFLGNNPTGAGIEAPSPSAPPPSQSAQLTLVEKSEIAKNDAIRRKNDAKKRMFDWFRVGGIIIGALLGTGLLVGLWKLSLNYSAESSKIDNQQTNLQKQIDDLKADTKEETQFLQSEINSVNQNKK